MIKTLFSLSFLISLGYLVSLVNQMIISSKFGTSQALDIFNYCFTIASGMFFFSPAINEASMPQFFQSKAKSLEEGSTYFSKVFNLIIVISVLLILGATLGFDLILKFFPNKDLNIAEVRETFFLLMPFVFLSAATFYQQGILNTCEKFVPQNVMKAIGSFCGLTFLFLTIDQLGIKSIIYSIEVSLAVWGISQFYFIHKEGIHYKPLTKISFDKTFLKVFLSLMAVFFLTSLYLVFEKWSFLKIGDGFVSAFLYSHKLFVIPHQIFFAGLVSIMWTKFMKMMSEKGLDHAKDKFFDVLNISVFLSLFVSIFMFFFSEEIIRILFFRGEFDHDSLEKTSKIFSILILGLPFLVGKDLVLRVITTMQHAKYISTVNMLYNIFATVGLLLVLGMNNSVATISVIFSAHLLTYLSSLIFVSKLVKSNDGYFKGLINIENIVGSLYGLACFYFAKKLELSENSLVLLFQICGIFAIAFIPVGLFSFKKGRQFL